MKDREGNEVKIGDLVEMIDIKEQFCVTAIEQQTISPYSFYVACEEIVTGSETYMFSHEMRKLNIDKGEA